MTTFEFTEEMMRAALVANGYEMWMSDDNWIRPDVVNNGWNGLSLEVAFKHLLRSKNLI